MAEEKKTAFSNTNWQDYLKVRPKYPQSLINLILEYHRGHKNAEWNRIVDVGCGIGVALTPFIPYFKTVHASDPSAANLESARQYLAEQVERLGSEAHLEFSQSLGEEAHKEVGEASCDVVICAMMAHYTDADALVASAAKMLRPGGSLAIYSYWVPMFPDQSLDFEDAHLKLFFSSFIALEKMGNQGSAKMNARLISNTTAGSGGLDFVPIPTQYFTAGQRVRINSGKKEMLYRNRVPEYTRFAGKSAESKVSSADQILDYYTDKGDAQAEGWSVVESKQWLYDMIDTVSNPEIKQENEEVQKNYADFDKIFDRECPSGTVRALFPCQLVLATRK